MRQFIGYHFFHGAGKVAPAEAYSRTQRAIEVFSDQKAHSYSGLMLDMRDDQGGPMESACRKLCDWFGPVIHTTTSPTWASYRAYSWNLSAAQLQESFSLLDALYREIPLSKERVFLQVSWSFKFIEPETAKLLPGQENLPVIDVRLGPGSSLTLAMGKKTSVNAWFLFPFEKESPSFQSYVSSFQDQLIFKFSPEHWRLWTISRAGEWRPKRFVPGWYAASASP